MKAKTSRDHPDCTEVDLVSAAFLNQSRRKAKLEN